MADRGSLAAARVRESLEAQARLLEGDVLEAVERAGMAIARAIRGGGKLVLFGNGGSAADAQHIAAELVGRYIRERNPYPAIALTANSSSVTAISNDYSFEQVFERQVRALCDARDVALGISTSGNSQNVVAGLAAARAKGAHAIALTGADGARLRAVSDECLCFPSSDTPRIQEGHTLMAHILCEVIENELAVA